MSKAANEQAEQPVESYVIENKTARSLQIASQRRELAT